MSKKRVLFVGEASFLQTGFSTYYRELLPRLVETGKYEIAEIGSYAREDNPGVVDFIKGRWKFYGVMPRNAEEQAAFNQPSNHPRDSGQNINQFGANVFNHAVADFKPDIVIDIRDNWMLCVLDDTPIITGNHVKHIQNIEVGDRVLTHRGNLRKVIETYTRNYTGTVHTIKSSISTLPVSLTTDHPILVAKSNVCRDGVHYPDWSKVEPEWIPVQNLERGDFLTFPIPKHTSDLDISNDFARLLGYYAAEGCFMYEGKKSEATKYKGIQLAFHRDEIDYIDDVTKIVEDRYSKKTHIKDVGNAKVLRIYGHDIASDISQYITGIAKSKVLDEALAFSSNEITAQFLCGLFRGDGGFNEDKGYYCTASRSLAFQVFTMCARLGLVPNWGENSNSIGDKKYQRYMFGFANRITFDGFKELIDAKVPSCRDKHKANDDYIFMRVKCIDTQDVTSIPVYNFEVDEDHSYVSSFNLHNCWQLRSPFRPWFKLIWMPTVDAEPQKEEWIGDYEKADMILAYSDYGVNALKRQSPAMRVFPSAMRPGVDLDTFKVLDRDDVRDKFLLRKDLPVIGTVMRNQSRKLYPDLLDAFARMKNLYAEDSEAVRRATLLIHSSWPDNQFSYDYPRHIMRLQSYDFMPNYRKGIKDDILQTLICHNPECGRYTLTLAGNLYNRPVENGHIVLDCIACGQKTATCPSSGGSGFTREGLAEVYNLMDLYVQCSICEGDGMPIQEAKACGVPTLVMDYTAMREKGRYPGYEHFDKIDVDEESYSCNLGGETIDVERYYYEPETSCMRALPDIDDLARKMRDILVDDDRRKTMSVEARQCVEKNYDWDELSKQWEFVLDKVTPKDRDGTWDSPIIIRASDVPTSIPDNLDDGQFIEWLYLEVLKYPKVDTRGAEQWMVQLQGGATRDQVFEQFKGIVKNSENADNARERIRAYVARINGEEFTDESQANDQEEWI